MTAYTFSKVLRFLLLFHLLSVVVVMVVVIVVVVVLGTFITLSACKLETRCAMSWSRARAPCPGTIVDYH